MKRQKLSTEIRQSLWSDLPPEIIHHIFSFLPSTGDAARTCLISKWWLQAWRSYFEGPSLIFILGEDKDVNYRKTEQFNKFVDKAMSRFDNRRIQKFVFDLPTFVNYDSLDKWINIAIDNHVQEMTLSKIRYPLQFLKTAVNNGSLRSLNLSFLSTNPDYNGSLLRSRNVNFLRTTPDHCGTNYLINLPNVVTLTLSMQVFNGKLLERFLKGCPLLETVTIGSDDQRASEIKVTGCDHLKTVNLRVHQDPKLVHIDAPNLETLRCSAIKTGERSVLSIDNCLNLKHLDLEFFTLDTEWFEGFLSRLASLETLKLKFENSLSSTKTLFVISNPLLKNLVLDRCMSPTGRMFFMVNVLKLLYFRYVGCKSSSHQYSEVLVYPPRDFIAHFRLMLDCREVDWLTKLCKTISPFSNLRSLSFVYCGKDHEIGSWWNDTDLPSTTVVETEHLKLTIDDDSDDLDILVFKYNKLLSGLFSICHPGILTIQAAANGHNKITRDYLELLGAFVIEGRCDEFFGCPCSDGTVKCWKRQLKNVEIKKDEFIVEDRSAVKISFMLKW